MGVCKCNLGLGNTGTSGCVPIMDVVKKLIIVPYFDIAGNVNSIDCTVPITPVFVTGKLNDDSDKRWYPTPGEIKNVEDVRGDSLFETFNDGSNIFIQEGPRTFAGLMPNQTPAMLGKLKQARCAAIGVFAIDKSGNLIGNGKVDGFLYPIRVDQNTWNPLLVKTTDTTSQKIALGFEYSQAERDEDLRMITADEITAELLQIKGLRDICFTGIVADSATDEISFTLDTIFGSQCNKVKEQGLTDADFTVTIEGLPGTITGYTEDQPGQYVLSVSDDIILADDVVVDIVKDGLEVEKGNTVEAT